MTGILGSSGIAALGALYGYGTAAAEFALQHIDTLKLADNALANRCGLVLEEMNAGFGMGSEVAMVLIGAGQALLGNPLTGAAASAAAGGIVNPVVLTCASIGAIHYGWNALNEAEKRVFLDTVARAFEVGAELIRSLVGFALDTIKALMTRENITELKKLVGNIATLFGKTLSDVTGAIGDRLAEVARGAAGSAARAVHGVTARLPKVG